MSKNQKKEPEMIKDSSVTLKELKERVKVLEENEAGLKATVASHEERIKDLESKLAAVASYEERLKALESKLA